MEQSDLHIVTRTPPPEVDLPALALQALGEARRQIALAIARDSAFATSFSPLPMPENPHPIVRDMILASARCGVGPMAAVAGAVAQWVGQSLSAHSPDVLVENGGDLYLISTTERTIGLLPDPSQDSALGLLIPADSFPLSICSSSALIGHSVSLGHGELVAVRAVNASFSDAAATALCNILRTAKDLDKVLPRAQSWSKPVKNLPPEFTLQGVFAQCQGSIAVWGDMELTAL